jgi:signal transduction histidine kinase
MRRSRLDVAWFASALGLLAAGVWTWWQTSPGASRAPFPQASMLAVWLATGVIVACWWRRSAAPRAVDAPFMAGLALAASAPLSMVPVAGRSGLWLSAALIAAIVATVPLAWSLAAQAGGPTPRGQVRLLVMALAVGASVASLVALQPDDDVLRVLRWALIASVAAVPGVLAALEALRGPRPVPVAAQQRLMDTLTLLAIGFAPALAEVSLLTVRWPELLLPAVAAGATALALIRFVVLPVGRIGSSAATQRDRVVVAMEAERTRLASVLHDGPLADITLLIQRLDDRGDADGAAVARSIASELRSIGSELRLPILDDLGAGPALEWLVGRMSLRTGSDVRLEHSTVARPPAPVELAAYRVAQEALVNALKHGASPITVRYRATPHAVRLSVDDAGPGLEPDAPVRAEREGRLGLASMAQRAEAIGARLVLAARPEGGTHVELEWRALPAASA